MSTPILSLLAVVVLVVSGAGCVRGTQGPVPVADAFVQAFAERRVEFAAELTTAPERAGPALGSTWDQLQADGLVARTGAAQVSGDTATVEYTYEWRLPKNRLWSYSGRLRMGRNEGRWVVRWTSSSIHPRLGDTQTMALRSTPAPRARVNEQSGSDVLVPGTVSRVSFSAMQAPDAVSVATTLAAVLHRADRPMTAHSILAAAESSPDAYTVAVLGESESRAVTADLIGLPGVTVTQEWDLVPTDREFAPALLAQVRETLITEVDGTAGWSVVTMTANGAETGVLTDVPPRPAPSFSSSIDRGVQNAAQQAVDSRSEQAVMVLLRPSTGAILAVAQNEAADRDGPIALLGLYPPGSVFKTVTAAAALSVGRATPDSILPCPSRIVIGERVIPNHNRFAAGNVSLTTAYEQSCNTSFAVLASELPGSALHDAAAQLGVGPRYSIVGAPTASGSVPLADDLVQRIEDGIGQGKVVVSPFAMALMAATVALGAVPVPYLIDGRPTEVDGTRPAPAPDVIEGLRLMMRAVVTGGTAERIADQGQVYGKTGEAETEGASHSWFVGFRGDIAFATLLVAGGNSDNAVDVTRQMLAALPAGY
ncbi:penicillin-binding transpeptidase domain-containing protein [Nocardia sp. CNY236]|uniref:penicillin-binding transpeptidase domain-containing protein n=1 Tax=Nocardia sp. CNY236 TaxID=1169152 RepID=UPI0004173782|nr:penicillin-binding transpeptidase domain-containing protein [Nocardia sp. CNY236]